MNTLNHPAVLFAEQTLHDASQAPDMTMRLWEEISKAYYFVCREAERELRIIPAFK